MKTLVRLMSVCSLVVAGVVASPSIASADSAPSEEVIGTTSAAHSHGSKMRMFKRALDAAELRPEQKAEVEKLISAAKDRHAPVKKAKGDFMVALADQIDSGKLDRCKLAPQTKALVSAMAKAKPGDREDFEKLHSILDHDQRGRFVDSLKSQYEEAKKAHNTEAIVHKMGRELNLSDDQKERLHDVIEGLKQIREAEPEHEEHRAKWQRILEGFRGDHFDLDQIAPMGNDLEAKLTRKIEGRIWAGEAVIPILNEEQRAKVAKMLRDKAQGIESEKAKAAQYQQGKEHEEEEEEEED